MCREQTQPATDTQTRPLARTPNNLRTGTRAVRVSPSLPRVRPQLQHYYYSTATPKTICLYYSPRPEDSSQDIFILIPLSKGFSNILSAGAFWDTTSAYETTTAVLEVNLFQARHASPHVCAGNKACAPPSLAQVLNNVDPYLTATNVARKQGVVSTLFVSTRKVTSTRRQPHTNQS